MSIIVLCYGHVFQHVVPCRATALSSHKEWHANNRNGRMSLLPAGREIAVLGRF